MSNMKTIPDRRRAGTGPRGEGAADLPWPLLDLDGGGRILSANAAAADFFDLAPQILIGLPLVTSLVPGLTGPGRIVVGDPPRSAGEVLQTSLTRCRPGYPAAWRAILVPPIGGGGSQRKLGEALSMQVAGHLLDPIRLAVRFGEKLGAVPDSKNADFIARLRKNLLAAEAGVTRLREHLAIVNREYRFEILDFKTVCEGALEASKRKWPDFKVLYRELPPCLLLGNPYLLRLLLEGLVRFARDGNPAGPDRMIVFHPLPLLKGARATHITLMAHCRGKGLAAISSQALYQAFNSVEPDRNSSSIDLHLSRQIVELHEGRMRCESLSRKAGVSFFLKFPLLPLQ